MWSSFHLYHTIHPPGKREPQNLHSLQLKKFHSSSGTKEAKMDEVVFPNPRCYDRYLQFFLGETNPKIQIAKNPSCIQ